MDFDTQVKLAIYQHFAETGRGHRQRELRRGWVRTRPRSSHPTTASVPNQQAHDFRLVQSPQIEPI